MENNYEFHRNFNTFSSLHFEHPPKRWNCLFADTEMNEYPTFLTKHFKCQSVSTFKTETNSVFAEQRFKQ